jgi:hypothetical protein
MVNNNKKGVVVLATDNKREFYDLIVSDILSGNIDLISELLAKEKIVLLSYDSFVGKSGERHEGFDRLFKLDGLIELINRFFITNKMGLVASKDVYNDRNVILISKFVRIKEGGLSKTDRRTDKDDIAIIENLSKDSDKEKILKKNEESRKLIQEG